MTALVGDVEALAEAIRDVLAQCTCTPYPQGDGPEIDCPMHGRADYQGETVAQALFASGAVASRTEFPAAQTAQAVKRLDPDERRRLRIRDDQCDVVLTYMLPDDGLCLLPLPCPNHDRADRLAQNQPPPTEAPDTALRAKVEALIEKWRYKGEFGWGPWQTGEGPDPEGHVLDECASDLNAALAATADDEQGGAR